MDILLLLIIEMVSFFWFLIFQLMLLFSWFTDLVILCYWNLLLFMVGRTYDGPNSSYYFHTINLPPFKKGALINEKAPSFYYTNWWNIYILRVEWSVMLWIMIRLYEPGFFLFLWQSYNLTLSWFYLTKLSQNNSYIFGLILSLMLRTVSVKLASIFLLCIVDMNFFNHFGRSNLIVSRLIWSWMLRSTFPSEFIIIALLPLVNADLLRLLDWSSQTIVFDFRLNKIIVISLIVSWVFGILFVKSWIIQTYFLSFMKAHFLNNRLI